MDLTIGPDLAGRVRLGILVLGASPCVTRIPLSRPKSTRPAPSSGRSTATARAREVPGAADARTLYKALGLDPTKTRPSNEALLRRALKGESLYRINTLVDALNLCSLRYQLPFGLYDLARIEPPVRPAQGRRRARATRGSARAPSTSRAGPSGRRARPLRQPDLGLGAHLHHASRPRARWSSSTRPPAYSPARLGEVLDGTGAHAHALLRRLGRRRSRRLSDLSRALPPRGRLDAVADLLVPPPRSASSTASRRRSARPCSTATGRC